LIRYLILLLYSGKFGMAAISYSFSQGIIKHINAADVAQMKMTQGTCHTHTHKPIHTLTHTQTDSHTDRYTTRPTKGSRRSTSIKQRANMADPSLFLSLFLTLSHSLSLSVTHTASDSLSHIHTHTHTLWR